jgi:hypothetical protein
VLLQRPGGFFDHRCFFSDRGGFLGRRRFFSNRSGFLDHRLSRWSRRRGQRHSPDRGNVGGDLTRRQRRHITVECFGGDHIEGSDRDDDPNATHDELTVVAGPQHGSQWREAGQFFAHFGSSSRFEYRLDQVGYG